MGFGLMFVGYFFAYLISLVFVPEIVGYAIMIWAAVKLSSFDLKFKRCLPVLGGLCLVSAYSFAGDVLAYFKIGTPFFNNTALSVASAAQEALVLAFNILLLIAVGSIAKDTGIDKIRFRAMRNLLLVVLSQVSYMIVIFLPQGGENEIIKTVFAVTLMLRFIWIFLNLMLLASCYRMICEEGDEGMPEKEINIPVIKQMESVMRRRDKNAFDSGKNWAEKRQSKKEKRKKRN